MAVDPGRVKSLFLEASDLADPVERAAYLDRACGGEAELRARVEALLAAHEKPGNVLDMPPAELGQARGPGTGEFTPKPGEPPLPQTTTSDYQPTSEPGAVIAGRYTLVEKIGEGGMGEVWVAKQTEPVKRKVALKLIKTGMDSKAVLARFEQERQALALMDHPNIAKVLDGGVDFVAEPRTSGSGSPAPLTNVRGSGRPFFVMELVNGIALTKFCDEVRLTPKERLELFVPICQAVQHAHQKGIVHRDLKPSNILVTMIDAKPVPKVIDFGVAKATAGKLTAESLSTQFGAVVGTLEYMSPEQAGFAGEDIDTRADIYSLGVLLYELLTGLRPIDAKRVQKAALTEMIRIIKEEEPSKPSTRLSTSESLASLAAARQTEPKRLMAMLRGELDWVVMKCLEKQRDRRYETANGLARDLQRYLADELVEARPPSAGYRLRKFARKHRAALAPAAVIAVLLVAGLSVSLWQMSRAIAAEAQANQNARQAQEERDAKDAALQAEQQARQQAFTALRSMTEDVVEKKFAQGTVLTDDDRAFLRGVIAQYDAFATINGDDADSRAARAGGRWRVGNMRFSLGEVQEAGQDYDQALSINKQLVAEFPGRWDFRGELAKCHHNRGNVQRAIGRLKEAEQDYDRALSIYRQLAADFPALDFGEFLAHTLNVRGSLLRDTGRLQQAARDYDEALSIQERLADEFLARADLRGGLAGYHTNRGNVLRASGRLREAEQDFDAALNIYQRLVADFPSRTELRLDLARSYGSRGSLLRDTGRRKEAEQDFDQALSIEKQLAADFPYRPEFREELAGSHNSRGILLSTAGRLKEAEQDYDQAMSIRKQLVADFPSRSQFRQELASSHMNRGMLQIAAGRLDDAEKDEEQALRIHKQLAADFPNQPDRLNDVAGTCVNLAIVYRRQGKWAAAKRLLLEGQPHHLAALKVNPRHPTYRQFYHNNLAVLTLAYAGLLEQEDAVRTAEMRRDLGWNAPEDAYDAACFLSRCIPFVAQHDKLDVKRRKEAVQFYGDAAMKFLREAVGKGYKDVAHMKKDTDLDPLRQREDFQKLIAELEGKVK
jgi:serine/threonine protein kinase